MLLSDEDKYVPGICGSVEDGILPGMIGYEAGQSCVGDHFAWFTENLLNAELKAEAEERKKIFNGYQINDEVMAVAKSDAMVLHCLPAHREEEITNKVFEAHAKEIFEEAENRLHAQKAVLVKLMKD